MITCLTGGEKVTNRNFNNFLVNVYALIILVELFQRFRHEPVENDEGVFDPRMEDDSDIEKSLIDEDDNDDMDDMAMDAHGKISNNMI